MAEDDDSIAATYKAILQPRSKVQHRALGYTGIVVEQAGPWTVVVCWDQLPWLMTAENISNLDLVGEGAHYDRAKEE